MSRAAPWVFLVALAAACAQPSPKLRPPTISSSGSPLPSPPPGTLADLEATKQRFLARARDVGLSLPFEVEVREWTRPSLMSWREEAHAVAVPRWEELSPTQLQTLTKIAGSLEATPALFAWLFRWFFLPHELAHALQGQAHPGAGHAASERLANDLAVAFYMEEPGDRKLLSTLAEILQPIVDRLPVLPQGGDATFDAHYDVLTADPAAYASFQLRFVADSLRRRESLTFGRVTMQLRGVDPDATAGAPYQIYAPVGAATEAQLDAAVRVVEQRLARNGRQGAVAWRRGQEIVLWVALLRDEEAALFDELVTRPGLLEVAHVVAGREVMLKIAERARSDPRALADEISAETDSWRDDKGRPRTDVYLATPFDRSRPSRGRDVLEAYLRATGGPIDHIGYERPDERNGHWRTYLLDASARATLRVTKAALADGDMGLELRLTFDEESARWFADMTGRLIGERLALIFDGEVQSAPVIMARIAGGRASILVSHVDRRGPDFPILSLLPAILASEPLPIPLVRVPTPR